MKVSACWIAKNEEKNLPRSMESVRNAVDEMIVVDTGSTDNTVKAAEELGAKVSFFEWVNDFSAARNRALELSEGELVIFLDCDEWFEPALTAENRKQIEKMFTDMPTLDGLQLLLNNLNDRGDIFDVVLVNRIFRRRPNLSFHWRVHEQYLAEGATPIVGRSTDLWPIMHSGYEKQVMSTKSTRNIPLLEQTVQDGSPEDAFRAHCYLAREYGNESRWDEALVHLRAVLDEPVYIKEFSRQMGAAFLVLLRPMMDLAALKLGMISVAEVDQKIVSVIETAFKDNPLSITMRLSWNFIVSGDEKRLLDEIDGALAASRRLVGSKYSTNLVLESRVLQPASVAAERRGELERAERYAIEDLKTGYKNPASLQLLLRLWRGTPLETVRERLDALFPKMEEAELFFLAKFSGIYGYQELSFIYLKEAVDNGAADDEVRIADAIMRGQTEEAKTIIDGAAERDGKTAKSPLAVFSTWELAKGFRAEEDGRFLIQAGMYEDVLTHNSAKKDKDYNLKRISSMVLDNVDLNEREDLTYALERVRALVMLRRDREALTELLPRLSKAPVDREWLYCLAVLSERLDGALGETARELLAMHRRFEKRMQDWGGVSRTGFAADHYTKKDLRHLAAMTEEELEKAVAADKREAATTELLDYAEEAGAVYEEKKMLGMALECWQFAFAHGRSAAETHMGRMIADIAKKRG